MDYPAGQTQWSDSKKLLYEENLHRVFYDPRYRDYLASFCLMVKSGEVYSTTDMEFDKTGYILNVSSRPRGIMNPTSGAFGIMQGMQ